jgi:acetolactate synthase-1/2/3 large subunit/5-guanidino-2-oxopentanoate decarboxylase
VLARHEQGAGFMADGYARASGKPGIAYVITGPGVCNIMTPMGQAYSDSVPMLVISSCLDETAAKRGQLHQMKDQEGAARTVCDWSETARTADAAYQLIDRALSEFHMNRRRPKHITLPIEALEGLAPDFGQRGALDRRDQRPPTALDVQSLGDKLKASRRPLFVFGGGCAMVNCAPIRSALRKLNAASITTYAGRGVITDDPLYFGSLLARASSARIFAQADFVVTVGTDLSEVDLWRDVPGHDCETCVINIDPEVLSLCGAGDVPILADAGRMFAALDRFLADEGVETDWTAREVSDYHSRMRAEIAAERPGILPVADALKDALPAETMIYSDMTQFAYAAKEVYPMDRPGHWHHPYGFGTLGYALPAAIGGKIGLGDQPVVAILGDYGFQYTVQELAVAVELELTLPIIIWDNGKLGEIEDSMVRAQIAPNAVVQRNPDFCKLAEAYGAAAIAPTDLASFQQAIKDALATKGPTIIHVKSDIALTSA